MDIRYLVKYYTRSLLNKRGYMTSKAYKAKVYKAKAYKVKS